MESCVLHLEIDDFLVAAAERCYPHLRGRAFVIAPLGADRARVQAASAPARTAGIHRGMLLKEAQKAEPRLWVHPLEERFYAALSGELVKILAGFSPVLEPWRYGQVYLEIFAGRAGWRQAREVAFRIQKEVVARLELKPAVGLGPNKLISRAASHRAARHHEILWVPPGHERPFIAPFRVQFLPHVNRRITGVLHNLNIWQVRELAALPRGQLQGLFGRVGWRIYEEARGIDPTPVMPPERRPGLYAEWAFAPETNDVEVIEGALVRLAGRVARRLRERGLLAATGGATAVSGARIVAAAAGPPRGAATPRRAGTASAAPRAVGAVRPGDLPAAGTVGCGAGPHPRPLRRDGGDAGPGEKGAAD